MDTEKTGYPSIDKPWLKWYPLGADKVGVPNCSMYSMLLSYNQDRLDQYAIKYFDNDITYRELFEKIKVVAGALYHRGIRKGDTVSILSLNTPETIYTIYALNYIGAVANLLMVGMSQNEVFASLKNTNSKYLFVLDKLLLKYPQLSESSIPVVVLNIRDSIKGIKGLILRMTSKHAVGYESFRSFCANGAEATIDNSADDLALILYTSGTTGEPKGVMLSSKNVNAVAVQCMQTTKNYQPGETFLNAIPPFLGFGIGMLHLCFCTGMEQIAVLVPKIKDITKAMLKYNPNRYVMGPAFTEVILNYPGKRLDSMVDCTGGGGAITLETERRINAILEEKHAKSKYYAGYGMTELASGISMNDAEHRKEQSAGIPYPLANFKVCDVDSGKEQQYNQEGELLIAAPNLMLGYYHDERATTAAIEIDNTGTRWLHTGDLAKIDEDGFVFITGRIKRIYITKDSEGIVEKIFPQRMEEVIDKLSCVNQSAVIVVNDSVRQNAPVVFISTMQDINQKEVRKKALEAIQMALPEYYIPKEICFLQTLPKTQSQKIDYRELERLYLT